MMKKTLTQKITVSAMLIAMGILIPMVSPIKWVIEPASFTLASHVAIFIGMMLAPDIAVAVSACTALGFLIGGFPIVIVLRAASHFVFALAGSIAIRKFSILLSPFKTRVFSFLIGILHAASEVLVATLFYVSGNMGGQWAMQSIFLLVGLGTVIHSMVDFEIGLLIVRALSKQPAFHALMQAGTRNQKVT